MDDGAASNSLKPFLAVLLLFIAVVFNGCAYFRPGPTYSAEESPRGGIKISDDTAGVISGAGQLFNAAAPFVSAW